MDHSSNLQHSKKMRDQTWTKRLQVQFVAELAFARFSVRAVQQTSGDDLGLNFGSAFKNIQDTGIA
jgi:hypothetical protein